MKYKVEHLMPDIFWNMHFPFKTITQGMTFPMYKIARP